MHAMTIQDESWTAIPDLHGYEISTSARVRSWKGSGPPNVLEGRRKGEDIVYDLAGMPYTAEELMRWTYEIEDGDWTLGHEPNEKDRNLTTYERSEIVLLEGVKPAHDVAEEFRINSSRVRGIWDGHER